MKTLLLFILFVFFAACSTENQVANKAPSAVTDKDSEISSDIDELPPVSESDSLKPDDNDSFQNDGDIFVDSEDVPDEDLTEVDVDNIPDESNVKFSPIMVESLEEVLSSAYDKYNHPNMVIGLYNPKKGFWVSSQGFFNAKENIAITNQDHFRIASISKTFTGATILKLYENGLIDLDETIAKWFPDYPQSDKITVRMLLNHSSSVPDYNDAGFYQLLFKDMKHVWAPEELIDYAKKKGNIAYGPGGGCTYSNTNYIMLGVIISKVTGEKPAVSMRNFYLNPLALSDTFLDSDETLPYEIVHGYWGDNDAAYWADPSAAWTAGAVASNAENIARWGYELYRGNLLKPETMNQMTDYVYGSFGLAAMKFCFGEQCAIGHTGGIPAYYSMLIYFPQKDISLVLLTASGPGGVDANVLAIGNNAAKIILDSVD